jgi:hypothetical protein
MRSHCNLHEHCLGVVHSATSRKSGGGPLFLPWPWRGALELLWGCDGVVTMLFPWVALVHPLYIPCTSLVHPLYIPCTSLVHPLYIPCTSLIHARGFRQPDGIATEPVPDSDSTGLAVIQMKFHEIQRAAHLLPSGGMGDFPDRQFGSKGRYLLSVVGPPTRNPTPIGPTAIASRLVDGR